MPRIFVSYSRVDRVSAEEITKRLRDVYGHEQVWMDDELSGGDIWWEEILRAINQSDIFLYLLSNDAVNSPYCRAEYQEANRLHKRIITAQVAPTSQLTEDLRQRQYVELSNWVHDPDQLNALHRAIHKQEGLIEKRARARQTGPTPRPIFSETGELTPPILPPPPRRPRWLGLALMGLLAVAGVLITMQLMGEGERDDVPTPAIDAEALTVAAGDVDETTATLAPSTTPTLAHSPTPASTATPTTSPTPHPSLALAQTGVSHNADWTPHNAMIDGVEMVLVPVGCFTMGSTEEQLAYAYTLSDEEATTATPVPLTNEQPAHEICFDTPFWIDRYEVTNAQFEQFGGAAALPSNWPDPDRPRERLSWDEARAFCAVRGARLPTEAEWEYAARGPDSLLFPWGDAFNAALVVSFDNSDLQTGAVGERPADSSWVGAHDMVGNVAEWVSTLNRDYPYTRGDGRENTTSRDPRVLRGGSYAFKPMNLRAASRYNAVPNLTGNGFGVRCVQAFAPIP